MASDVQIANMALTYLGVDPITNLAEDSTPAKKVNAIYNLTRDSLLADHNWSFAVKRTSLARLSETPSYGYSYFFQLPSDFVTLVETKERFEHRIEGDKLATDNDSVSIEYIYRLTDPAKFSTSFVELLALRLASDLAYSMVGSITLKQDMNDKYKKRFSNVKTLDSAKSVHRDRSSAKWITTRSNDVSQPVYGGVVDA
jgi:hypothetical protein